MSYPSREESKLSNEEWLLHQQLKTAIPQYDEKQKQVVAREKIVNSCMQLGLREYSFAPRQERGKPAVG